MSKISLVSDSTCDLSKELIAKYDIEIVPLHILLGEAEYEDGVTITPDEIYRWSDEHKETPKTSDTSVSESQKEIVVKGEGKTKFSFSVTDKDGNTTDFEISTDKTIVGEALQELGLIEGDESEYGLFVKKVNGITADFDVDKTYWAFYVNGSYASSGVDTTEIKEGESYAFKVEK